MDAGGVRVFEGYLDCALEQTLGDLLLRVDCSLSAGWTIVFGPSGAGKTSLLRLLAGLARPHKGRVVLQGRILVDTAAGLWVTPAERGIGFVSQQPALFAHMNVTDNVSFGLSAMGRQARRERAAEMLSLFQASALAGKKPAELSGGEKQRVALARALAPGPELLLLDEPFTGLDGHLKATILAELTVWLAARGIPALYVSHDVVEAFQTGGEVLVLEKGQVTAQGPAAVVLARQRDQLLRQLTPGSRPPK